MNYNDCLGNTKNYIGITMIVFRNDSALLQINKNHWDLAWIIQSYLGIIIKQKKS